MNITKNFENWQEFLVYVDELKKWLFANNYVHWWRPNMLNSSRPCRDDIMKDEDKLVQDLKEKELYEQYVEYFNNCKNYLDNNIVTRNNNKNVRYQEFDFSFRFVGQEECGDFSSVFVWSLLNMKDTPNNEYAYNVTPEVIYKLPHNPKYFELGVCWYSKDKYTIDDITNGFITKYTTKETIESFIETIVKVTPHKEGLPKLACMKTIEKRSSYSGPGPISHWDVGVSGFKVTPIDETYSIVSGVLSMSTCSVNLFYDTVSYENQKSKKLRAKTKIEKIDNAIAMLGLEKGKIKSINWYNEVGPTHIINNDGDISIYCFHKGLDEEFQSLRGNHTMNRPYDPAVWGWT